MPDLSSLFDTYALRARVLARRKSTTASMIRATPVTIS
jgi:hypothetical protein